MSVASTAQPRFRASRATGLALLVVVTAALAWRSVGAVLERVGHPAPTLDDAYIHFQYARAFAEGHPFRFQAGEPISTGATSFLWPALLAPFHAIGFRGEAIMWPAWAISYVALAALAYETHALTRPLAGRTSATAASAMVLAFGGFAWCAASGMEVVPFAWLIASASRRGSEWAERPEARTRRSLLVLLAFATGCPLMRPEGSLTALAIGLVVFAFPRRAGASRPRAELARAEAIPFVLAAFVPTLLLLLLTGSSRSSTAAVKLLAGNPYYDAWETSLANARLLVGTILDGQVWSAEFLPKGSAGFAFLGLASVVVRGSATRRSVRAALVVLLALSMFVPCTYVTFLWNRLRYLWPFATGWLIGLACLARTTATLVSRLDRRLAVATSGIVAGAFVGALVVRLDGVIDDVAQSASGIDRQQAALGRWARSNLPVDARIGVNDTGAIAYFGDRKTFDVVGLTTPTEGRYWVAGSGSRLEHYERLRAEAPSTLPTHFIVYPEWMACEPVIGTSLHEATVTDATILGGQTMRVSEARWDYLGSGERPWTPIGRLVDTLDVADLESEREHGYGVEGAREGEEIARMDNAPDGAIVVDGGRIARRRDRFVVALPAGEKLVGVARVESATKTALRVLVDGAEVARLSVEPGPWSELTFSVPDSSRGARSVVEVIADGPPFASFHYWFGAVP